MPCSTTDRGTHVHVHVLLVGACTIWSNFIYRKFNVGGNRLKFSIQHKKMQVHVCITVYRVLARIFQPMIDFTNNTAYKCNNYYYVIMII